MTQQVTRLTLTAEIPCAPLAALSEPQARAHARRVGQAMGAQAEAMVIKKWTALQAAPLPTAPPLPTFVAPDGRMVVDVTRVAGVERRVESLN